MGGDGSTVLLYQPQVESWKDEKVLRARMAVAFRRMGTPVRPSARWSLEGDTSTSIEAGQVRISNIRIVEGRFPGLSRADSDAPPDRAPGAHEQGRRVRRNWSGSRRISIAPRPRSRRWR